MTRNRPMTRKFLSLERLEDRLCLSALPFGPTPLAQPNAATQARASAAYGKLPLSFEANQGQVDPQVNFLSRSSGYTLFLTRTEAVLSLQQPANNQGPKVPGTVGDVLRMQLVGANSAPAVAGLDQQAGKTNYFIGSDPTQWHTDIANYGKVQYRDVYPGVDLLYYGNQRQLEYDFVVAPGADPNAITLAFQGTAGMNLDSAGNLVLHTAGGDVVEQAPFLYQETHGVRQAVSGQYVLEGPGEVGFQVGAYDPTRPLVIDPVYALVYSTYLGGSGTDIAYGVAVDAAGNAYLTGRADSSDFPTTSTLLPHSPAQNVFVTKLNAAGSGLVYSTILGGNSGGNIGLGIAVDSAGHAYVTGWTSSTSFPTMNAFQPNYGGGTTDAFLAKLDPSGSSLLYSGYLGGSGMEDWSGGQGFGGVAVDDVGNAYMTGFTTSANFPTAKPLQRTLGAPGDAYVARVNTTLAGPASLVYSTFLGGAASDYGYGIAVGGGNAYVTGATASANFHTTAGVFQAVFGGGAADAFVAKLNGDGSALVYSTYVGGGGSDVAYGIAVDGSGNASLTGRSQLGSTTFPTTAGAFQTIPGSTVSGTMDAFVTVLNAAGSGLVYSTYLGGIEQDQGKGIAVDGAGHIYVSGSTSQGNFPTKNAFQPVYGGGQFDAFVADFDPSQTGSASLVYASYLGGSGIDLANTIAVDGAGNAYVAGQTGSTNFPTLKAFQAMNRGNYDAFVTKIDPPADAVSARASNPTAGWGLSTLIQPNALIQPTLGDSESPLTVTLSGHRQAEMKLATIRNLDSPGRTDWAVSRFAYRSPSKAEDAALRDLLFAKGQTTPQAARLAGDDFWGLLELEVR